MKKLLFIIIFVYTQMHSQVLIDSFDIENITNQIENLNTKFDKLKSLENEVNKSRNSLDSLLILFNALKEINEENSEKIDELQERFYDGKGKEKRDYLEEKADSSTYLMIKNLEFKLAEELKISRDSLKILLKKQEAQQESININESKANNNKYLSLIIGLLLIITFFIIYFLLMKNKKKVQGVLEMDKKIKNILEKQLTILEQPKTTTPSSNELDTIKEVADEIITMENNIFQMDKSTRGLNRIERAITNMRNNFKIKGYDIPILLGNEYRDGDIVEVISEETGIPSIEKGKRIITHIVKPQINHNNKVIQRAKVKLKSNL